MAKPTPIPTAQRALATAIKALESISISTGIKGTAIKLGNEFVTQPSTVLNDLLEVKADAQALVDGLNTMINKLAETANTERLEAVISAGTIQRGLCNEIPVHTAVTSGRFESQSLLDIGGGPDNGTDGESGSYLSQAEFEASGLAEVYDWETQDGDSVTPSEFVEAELNSTVPIERTAVPELFAATPSF